MEDYEKLQELLRKADDYTAVQLELWNVPIGDPIRAKLYFAVFNTRLAALIETDPPKNTPNPTASYRLIDKPVEPERPTRKELLDLISDILSGIEDAGSNVMSNHNANRLHSAMNREMNMFMFMDGLEIDTQNAFSWANSWINLMRVFMLEGYRYMPDTYQRDPELLHYDMYTLWLPADPEWYRTVTGYIHDNAVWRNHVLPALQTFNPNLKWEV